jgi:hypothetical protein
MPTRNESDRLRGIHFKMVRRCHNPRDSHFAHYGGRGITVCNRWRTSFDAFLADMGPRPSPAHSIDRIDNDGPYSPENCRWATAAEQRMNRQSTRRLTHHGETLTVMEWADRLGVPYALLRRRIDNGWSLDEAAALPSLPKGRTIHRGNYGVRHRITHAGATATIAEWSRRTGIDRQTLSSRLRSGWPVERALSTPVKPRNRAA